MFVFVLGENRPIWNVCAPRGLNIERPGTELMLSKEINNFGQYFRNAFRCCEYSLISRSSILVCVVTILKNERSVDQSIRMSEDIVSAWIFSSDKSLKFVARVDRNVETMLF